MGKSPATFGILAIIGTVVFLIFTILWINIGHVDDATWYRDELNEKNLIMRWKDDGVSVFTDTDASTGENELVASKATQAGFLFASWLTFAGSNGDMESYRFGVIITSTLSFIVLATLAARCVERNHALFMGISCLWMLSRPEVMSTGIHRPSYHIMTLGLAASGHLLLSIDNQIDLGRRKKMLLLGGFFASLLIGGLTKPMSIFLAVPMMMHMANRGKTPFIRKWMLYALLLISHVLVVLIWMSPWIRFQLSSGSDWSWWAATSKTFVLTLLLNDLGWLGCVFAIIGVVAFLRSDTGMSRWIGSGPLIYAIGTTFVLDELTGRLFIPIIFFLPILAAKGLVVVCESIICKVPEGRIKVVQPTTILVSLIFLLVGVSGTLREGVQGTNIREFTDDGAIWIYAEGNGGHDWFDGFRDDQGYAYQALLGSADYESSDLVLHNDIAMAMEYLDASIAYRLDVNTNGAFDGNGKQVSPWNQSTVDQAFNGTIVPDVNTDTIWFVVGKGELWNEMGKSRQKILFENFTIRFESERAYLFSRLPLSNATVI